MSSSITSQMIVSVERVEKIKSVSYFCLWMKTNLVVIMRTLWIPYRSEFHILLGVMICTCVFFALSVCVCVCGSLACRVQGSCCLCGAGCVEFMLCNSEIISSLPRKLLVTQQISQNTLSSLYVLHFQLSPKSLFSDKFCYFLS